MNEIYSLIITSAVNLIIGLGGLLLFFPQLRRKHSSEADNSAVTTAHQSALEWKEIAEKREAKINKQNDLIDKLYEDKDAMRRKEFEDAKTIADLEIEKAKDKVKLCEKKCCSGREPQSGY